jgi:hypothetical protein
MQSSSALQVVFMYLDSCKLHQRMIIEFPLYRAFASVMSSMVSGQESVVNPTTFVNLFRERRNINHAQGMFFDRQWMNQLTMYVPLTDYSSR